MESVSSSNDKGKEEEDKPRPLRLLLHSDESQEANMFGPFAKRSGIIDLSNRTTAQKERLEILYNELALFDETCLAWLKEAERKLSMERIALTLWMEHTNKPLKEYEHALRQAIDGAIDEAWLHFPENIVELQMRLASLDEWAEELIQHRCELKLQRDLVYEQRYRQLMACTPQISNPAVEEFVTLCERGNLYEVMKIVKRIKGREEIDDGWVKLEDAIVVANQLDVKRFINSTDSSGIGPLHAACGSGCLEIVAYLLSLGADPMAKDHWDGYGPVHWTVWGSALHPWLDTMHLLKAHDGAIRMLGHAGHSALHVACLVGSLDAVEWLVQEGLSFSLRETEGARRTPLHIASWKGFHRVVSFLLEQGANPRYPPNGNGESAVLEAALCKHEQVLRSFLDHGYWPSMNEMDIVRDAFANDKGGLLMIQRVLHGTAERCAIQRKKSVSLPSTVLQSSVIDDRWRSLTVNVVSTTNSELLDIARVSERKHYVDLEFENNTVDIDMYSVGLYGSIVSYDVLSAFTIDDVNKKDKKDEKESESVKHIGFDWNEEYQRRLGSVKTAGDVFSNKISAHCSMAQFGSAFLDTALKYGMIILSERHLADDNDKTIHPVQGGIAGGQKFHVQQLYFKLAVDDKTLYSREPDWMNAPAKVAGLDLKGLVAYSSCQHEALSFPCMVLIDYLGERLVCMGSLPISENSTMVFGSSDGGNSVKNSDPVVANAVLECAKKLNLALYSCSGVGVVTFDLEGHVGHDGRNYLLDFSRSMPPDCNVSRQAFPAGQLYQLLRPELVASNIVALCPDSLSHPFVLNNGPSEFKTNVKSCSTRLVEQVIPELVQDFLKLGPIPLLDVTVCLHSKGVNCRYIGQVVQHLHDAGASYWAYKLLEEGICRCIKADIRLGWRNLMKDSSGCGQIACILFFVKHMNLYFGNSRNDTWDSVLLSLFSKKFAGVSMIPSSGFKAWYLAIAHDHERTPLCSLFSKVVSTLGVRMTSRALLFFSRSDKHFDCANPLLQLDIEALDPVYKTVPEIHMSQALYFKTLLRQSRDGQVAQSAIHQYERVLRMQPLNAIAWAELGDLCLLDNSQRARAKYCLNKAMQLAPDNPDVLYKYGKLLYHSGDTVGARECWNNALEKNPNHEPSLECLRILEIRKN
jgi:hypothetical protein